MMNNYCSRKNRKTLQDLCGIWATNYKCMLHHLIVPFAFVESIDVLKAASLNKREQVYYLSGNIAPQINSSDRIPAQSPVKNKL